MNEDANLSCAIPRHTDNWHSIIWRQFIQRVDRLQRRIAKAVKEGRWGKAYRERWDSILEIPIMPNVSMGWDNSLRHPDFGRENVVHMGNSPESFGMYLQEAREFLDDRPEQPPLIILNAWNEWIEGSYLEPDMKWGYGYLEAVKKIMSGKYDNY